MLGDGPDPGALASAIQITVHADVTDVTSPQLLNGRNFVPPGATWQCMVTFLVVTTRRLCRWRLVGRAQGCC